MAIVKMNKFTLLTFESKKEKLLHRLQGFSNVEFINLQDENIIENNEAFQSLSKDEVDSQYQAGKTCKMVPLQRVALDKKNGEEGEDNQGDNLLNYF